MQNQTQNWVILLQKQTRAAPPDRTFCGDVSPVCTVQHGGHQPHGLLTTWSVAGVTEEPVVPVLDSAGLGSSSKDQALGTGLIIQITHCANCPQRQTHIEHTDSHVANTGSRQVVWEWPGTEKLAKRMCKRHDEAPFCRNCDALWASICNETHQRASSSLDDQS